MRRNHTIAKADSKDADQTACMPRLTGLQMFLFSTDA